MKLRNLIITTILLSFLSNSAFSKVLSTVGSKVTPSENSQIILQALFKEAGGKIDITPTPIPEPEPDSKPDQAKIDKIKKKMDPIPTPKKIIPSGKGKKYIEEQLKKNRKQVIKSGGGSDYIKKMLEKNRRKITKSGGGKDYIEKMKAKNRGIIKENQKKKRYQDSSKPKSIHQEYLQNLHKLKQKNRQTISNWRKTTQETYKRWREKRKEFLKNLKYYKENLVELDDLASEAPITEKKKLTPIKNPISMEYHLIPGAFDVPIRNQGRRPTCAAFAGIRAIETVLSQHNMIKNLSEQYFYWMSKPKCQTSPCTQKGSWVGNAFRKSVKLSNPTIPLEKSCPYKNTSVQGNETQIPLASQCDQGFTGIESFDYLDTLDETLDALDNNYPIIAGFKLSPNFYKTDGLITYADSRTSGNMDSHAKGHALLLVGYIKLPASISESEGKVCFITANSWGEGWGRGGFGCLTENWIKHYRIQNAFVALKQIKL